MWTLSALNGRQRTDWYADVGPTTYYYHRTTAIAATDAAVAVVFVAAVLGGGGARIVRNIRLPVCVLARNANGALLLLLLFRVFDNDDGWL